MKGLEDVNYCVKNFFPLGHGAGIRLSAGYLTKLAERCPDMKEFRIQIVRLDSWPKFNKPWRSLVTLCLMHVDVVQDDGFASLGTPEIFPSLRYFEMESCSTVELPRRTPLLIPDFKNCKSLESVILSDMYLKFPNHPENCFPFPQYLKKLVFNKVNVSNFSSSDLKSTMEKKFYNCDLKLLNEPYCRQKDGTFRVYRFTALSGIGE